MGNARRANTGRKSTDKRQRKIDALIAIGKLPNAIRDMTSIEVAWYMAKIDDVNEIRQKFDLAKVELEQHIKVLRDYIERS